MASPRKRKLAKRAIAKAREEAAQPVDPIDSIEEENVVEKVKKKGKKLLDKILGKGKKKK